MRKHTGHAYEAYIEQAGRLHVPSSVHFFCSPLRRMAHDIHNTEKKERVLGSFQECWLFNWVHFRFDPLLRIHRQTYFDRINFVNVAHRPLSTQWIEHDSTQKHGRLPARSKERITLFLLALMKSKNGVCVIETCTKYKPKTHRSKLYLNILSAKKNCCLFRQLYVKTAQKTDRII